MKKTDYDRNKNNHADSKKGVLKLLGAAFVCLFFAQTNANVYGAEANVVPDISTRIIFENGSEKTVDEAVFTDTGIVAKNIDDISGYRLCVDGEKVLEVSVLQRDSSDTKLKGTFSFEDRRYSVRLNFKDNKEAYVTGLTADNVDRMEEFIICNYEDEYGAVIEDPAFIDAEKVQTFFVDDDNLCWAAMSSNLLTYTGWAEYAGFEDEDSLFSEYVANFDNTGAAIDSGIEWFFDGVAESDSNIFTKNSGGFISDYSYDQIVEERYVVNDYADYKKLKHALDDGYGVGLGITFGRNTKLTGGHAVSCWGYIVDNNYSECSMKHYLALIISDSDDYDDDYREKNQGSQFENKLNLYQLEDLSNQPCMVDNNVFNVLGLMNYSSNSSAITSYITVKPYSDTLSKETDAKVTKDKRMSPDLVPLANMYLNSAVTTLELDAVSQGENVSLNAFVLNLSDVDFKGEFSVKIELLDSDSKVIKSQAFYENRTILPYRLYEGTNRLLQLEAGKLPVGNYTVRVSCSTGVTEAYSYNNVAERSFSVVPSKSYPCKLKGKISKYFSKYGADYLEAGFEMTGFSETIVGDTTEYCIFTSVKVNGKWQNWVEYTRDLKSLKCPKKEIAVSENRKLRFMVVVNMRDKGAFAVVSDEISLSKPVINNATKIKAVNNGKKKIKVTFTKSKNAKSYTVQISTKKNFSSKKITKTVKTGKATFKNLKKGKTYYVRIKAKSGSFSSKWSKIVKVKVRR